jgi:hypothetical protein
MSLASGASIIGGVKEYLYRGIRQLPLILGSTSLIYTIGTGSIVHANLAGGIIVLMPIYTYLLQLILGWILNRYMPGSIASWTRTTGDMGNLVPDRNDAKTKQLSYYDPNHRAPDMSYSVPSYWLMSFAFFVGYTVTNGVDSLMSPAQPNADPSNHEKRTSHAIYVISMLSVLTIILLAIRVTTMRGCDGSGMLGMVLSFLCAAGAAGIGYGIYILSKKCGSRASDLFGILSQILPASATAPQPVVCTNNY